jgi:hypothetical protein
MKLSEFLMKNATEDLAKSAEALEIALNKVQYILDEDDQEIIYIKKIAKDALKRSELYVG